LSLSATEAEKARSIIAETLRRDEALSDDDIKRQQDVRNSPIDAPEAMRRYSEEANRSHGKSVALEMDLREQFRKFLGRERVEMLRDWLVERHSRVSVFRVPLSSTEAEEDYWASSFSYLQDLKWILPSTATEHNAILIDLVQMGIPQSALELLPAIACVEQELGEIAEHPRGPASWEKTWAMRRRASLEEKFRSQVNTNQADRFRWWVWEEMVLQDFIHRRPTSALADKPMMQRPYHYWNATAKAAHFADLERRFQLLVQMRVHQAPPPCTTAIGSMHSILLRMISVVAFLLLAGLAAFKLRRR
jgi:hypothetical protein